MDVLDIGAIRELCTTRQIKWTQHSLERCGERNIYIADVKNALVTGEIIEQYPTDYPFPSCLVLGISVNERNLHVVCSVGDNFLWIISAYYPDNTKWENDFKTRKGNK
jgi:hypothetical protein